MKIYQNTTLVGSLGIVSSNLREKYDLLDNVFYFELFLDSITVDNDIKYTDFSIFPKIKRDISLKLKNDTSIEDVMNCIRKSSLKYMINSRISDIFYSKDAINSYKTVTIELLFQHLSTTLSDKEVNEQMLILMNLLKTKLSIDIK